jgi:hypothetical protein
VFEYPDIAHAGLEVRCGFPCGDMQARKHKDEDMHIFIAFLHKMS